MTNSLNLPSLSVTDETPKENEHDIGINVVAAEPPKACPLCGSIANLSRFGTKKQRFMDTTMYGKRVGVILTRQRYRCKDCDGTFFEPLPSDLDERRMMTKRAIKYIADNALNRPFTAIADEIGVDEKTVRTIFYKHYQEQDKEQKRNIIAPEYMGIDEIYIIGKPRGVITNIKERTIVEMLEDRKEITIRQFLEGLQNKQDVKFVAMDMWLPYKRAVNDILPNARVSVDKFHVVRLANNALETVRKSYRKTLKVKQRRQLKNDRFLMLRRRKDLEPFQVAIMETWTFNFPKLGQAYDLKERFYDLWDVPHSEAFIMEFMKWKASIPDDMQDTFGGLAKTVENWMHEIIGYFHSQGLTNAYTESINSVIRTVDRMGRGYSFDVLRTKMLHTYGVRKKKRPGYDKSSMMEHFIGRIRWNDIFEPDDYGADISALERMVDEGLI